MQQTEIDFNWPPEKVEKSTPEQLFNLIQGYAEYTKVKIHDNKVVMDKEQWKIFQYDIMVEWGKWSHSFNKILRRLIKECDLFQGKNDEIRVKGKKLSTCYLFWNKWTHHLEAITNLNIFTYLVYISKTLAEIQEVKTYFENIDKMEIVLKPTLRSIATSIKKEKEDDQAQDANNAADTDKNKA